MPMNWEVHKSTEQLPYASVARHGGPDLLADCQPVSSSQTALLPVLANDL